MNRLLATLSSSAVLAAAASAQCFETNFGTALGTGDDTLLAVQPLGINFPMGGAFATYDQVRINTNGAAFLWNSAGGAPLGTLGGGYSTSAATMVTNLRGAAGGAPRIAPYWRDLNITAGNNGNVWLNNTIPGKAVITWENAVHWNVAETPFTFQAQLIEATGEIIFFYQGVQNATITPMAGVSQGGGIADAGPTDLSTAAVGVSTSPIVYETWGTVGTFDLAGTSVLFVPNGGGGYDTIPSACGAGHQTLGVGCYDVIDSSIYELHADAALASAALQGTSVSFTLTGGTYLMQTGGNVYQAPVSPTNLFAAATDDGEVVVDLSSLGLAPLNTPSGPQNLLRIHSNGVLSWGASALNFPGTQSYQPTAAGFLDSNNGGIYFWHDYNESESGSGRIQREVVGSQLHVTWNDVENWSSPTTVNRSTLQLQIDPPNSMVTVVWQSVDTDTTSTFGSQHLVGFTPPGTSLDAGSQILSSVLPLLAPKGMQRMSLSAAPAPVINPSTLVTYTATNVPEFIPGSGVYVSTMFLSVSPFPAGIDLAGILTNTPGCSAYIGSLDLDLGVQLTQTANWNFTFDNVLFAPGNVIAAQAVALYDTNFPLPNGENGGFTTSNGVQSRTDLF